ncbi:MAG: pilus assembly protein, partial [Planctomycetaceae bacterium]|nr:pilus assembly protein [Planctomycetaceae bacterium]
MISHRQVPAQRTVARVSSRRGAVLLWFIVALPVLLTLLCVVLEVANLYLARAELQNALEAAAQAAVKDWAENSNIPQARAVGNAYAMANTINGVPVDLTTVDDDLFPLNQNGGNSPNQ